MSHKFRNAFKVIKLKCQLYFHLSVILATTNEKERIAFTFSTVKFCVIIRVCVCTGLLLIKLMSSVHKHIKSYLVTLFPTRLYIQSYTRAYSINIYVEFGELFSGSV